MAHANKKQIALYVTAEQDEKITMHAKDIGVSKQKLLSNLVDTGLDDLDLLKKSGLLMIGKGFRNLVDRIRSGDISSVNSQDS